MTTEAHVSHDDLFNAASVRDARAGRRQGARARTGRKVGTREHHSPRALRTCCGRLAGLEDVFVDVPALARPEFGATGAAVDGRSSEAHSHTSVVSAALSPQVLNKLAADFRADANALVTAMKRRAVPPSMW